MSAFNLPLALIVLRESLEAFLLLSIFAGMATKLHRPEGRRYLFLGAVSALALTVAAGILVDSATAGFLEDKGAEPIFVGIASLVAVGILTYMVVWMYKHTLGLVAHMHVRTRTAFESRRPMVLAAIAFVAVIREGMEAVILIPSVRQSTGGGGVILSAAIGLVLSAALAALIFGGFWRLSLTRFFAASSLLLIVFGAGLLGTGIHELTADRLVAASPHWQAWDASGLLDDGSGPGAVLESTLGYHAAPTWLDVAAYVGYLATMLGWYATGRRRHKAPGATPEHDAPNDG